MRREGREREKEDDTVLRRGAPRLDDRSRDAETFDCRGLLNSYSLVGDICNFVGGF